MSGTGYMEVLSTAQAAGPALASFTTAATVLPAQALYTIPSDDWWVGKVLLVRAAGRIGNVVTAQPTFTFNLMFGATVVWTSGAMLTSTTAHTTVPWVLDLHLTVRAIGTSANLMGQATFYSRAVLDSGATADLITGGHPVLLAPETTPAVGNNFSTNAAQQVDLQVACSVSNAANTMQLEQYMITQMQF